MITNFSAGRRLLVLAGALLLLAAPLGERTAKADFIAGNYKLLECTLPSPGTCEFPVGQQFFLDPPNNNNDVTVNKTIFIDNVQTSATLDAFHVMVGLWPEKDLKHIGFACGDPPCVPNTGSGPKPTLTGFGEDVRFGNPQFVSNIPDLHGLTSLGTIVPDVKIVTPQQAIDWLPDRFRTFFDGFNVVNNGMVPVLFSHIPEPATVTLLGFGLLGLGLATRRRRTA